jgi:adenine-specific DNA glycosylase
MWVLPKIDEVTDLPYLGSVSTVVTHHKITIALYRATELSEGATWFKKDSIEDLPIPAPFRRALKLALQNDTPSLF